MWQVKKLIHVLFAPHSIILIGYGFLSENASFVKALDAAGVTFIGPSEDVMAAMDDKIQSKIIA